MDLNDTVVERIVDVDYYVQFAQESKRMFSMNLRRIVVDSFDSFHHLGLFEQRHVGAGRAWKASQAIAVHRNIANELERNESHFRMERAYVHDSI